MASKFSALLFYVAAFCAISCISAQDDGDCPTLYVKLNNRCYLFSEDESLKFAWADAQHHCNLYTVGEYKYDLLVLDDDIEEPPFIASYMKARGLGNALIGARDLNLTQSEWVWVDGSLLSLQSSIWSCRYPSTTSFDNVGYYSNVHETIDNDQTVDRFRLKNVAPTAVEYFICEGPLIPPDVLSKDIKNA